MSLTLDYNEDVGEVSNITFGILSPERILEKSCCEINRHITSSHNLAGTVKDPRLGIIKSGLICPTCENDYKLCPGHFGHLVLAKPVIQYQYFNNIVKILSSICNTCSHILINKKNTRLYTLLMKKRNRNKYNFYSLKKNILKECPNCGAKQPKYSKDKTGVAKIVAKLEETMMEIDPEIILNIFKRISDEDVSLLGFNPELSRPEWMLWTIMPIPPPHVRPSVESDSGKVSLDDLTHKLIDIIKFNNQLRLKLEDTNVTKKIIDEIWQLVQYHVITYVDNDTTGVPTATHRSGRPLKTLQQRQKGKGGRIRSYLMGKRVNGTARSVITADPNISIEQLGVPLDIAKNLVIPEHVTRYNIAKLTQLVRNGVDVYPGAKSYKRRSERNKKNLQHIRDRNNIRLSLGDTVYRNLMDNDIVLFNRQPTLHKMSMMAHRVKVLPGKTFRLNVNVTSPYNADFDGDKFILSPTGGFKRVLPPSQS